MNRYFTSRADKEYTDWRKLDKKTFKKINDLVDDIEANGMMVGIGKPEQLKHYDKPTYSRRIARGDRLVYQPYGDNDLLILSCRGHYDDK